MSADSGPAERPPSAMLLSAQALDAICDEFEQRWRAGERPRLEVVLEKHPPECQRQLLVELLSGELHYRRRLGEQPSVDEYLARLPELAATIREAFADHPQTETVSGQFDPEQPTMTSAPPSITGAAPVPERIGHYQLLKKLGEGGMGAVYQARHIKLRKIVALKLLPEHLTSNAAAVARFEREMTAIGTLEHPNIVRAFDAGEDHGRHYLVMEFFEGVDVAKKVRETGPLSVPLALQVLRQAALGLGHAHEVGLIHRDVKPSNLLWTARDEIKVLDLGLARLLDDQAQELTASGQIFGTPDYMAPEQWESTHGADVRADLYSLGCTLHFLLTGRAPFFTEGPRTTGGIFKAHLMQTPPDLTLVRKDVPPEVNLLFQKLMAKAPAARTQTAAELVQQIDRLLALFVPSSSGGSMSATIAEPASSLARFFELQMNQQPPTARIRKHTPRMGWGIAGVASMLVLLFVVVTMTLPKNGEKTQANVFSQGNEKSDTKASRSVPSESLVKTPDYAKERAVADWVLSMGGSLHLTDATTGARFPLSNARLPAEPFLVNSILLIENHDITNTDLKRLDGLSSLDGLGLPGATRLTDSGVSALAAITTLQGVDFSGINLTDDGVEPLARLPRLIYLNMAGTQISNRCLAKFAEGRQLKGLTVSSLPVEVDLLRLFADHPLEWLGIENTRVRSGDLVEIAALFPSLNALEARGLLDAETPIPAAFFQRLNKSGKLKLLCLSGCLEPAALDELVRSTTMDYLRWQGWNGGDAELLRLATMPKLAHLELISTNVTVEGAQKFHAARPDVAISGDFNLPATVPSPVKPPRTPDFAKEREVAEWVLSIGGTLGLSDAATGQPFSAGAALPATPFVISRIYLVSHAQMRDVDLKRLGILSRLSVCVIPGAARLTDAAIPALAEISTLQHLDLSSTAITDLGMDQLANMPELDSINLGGTKVTAGGLLTFSKRKRMKGLAVGGLPIGMDELRHFAGHPLGSLVVQSTRVRSTDLAEIATLFPELSLVEAHKLATPTIPIPAEFFTRLATNGKLNLLRIGGLFEPAAVDELARNPTIEHLQLEEWVGGENELLRLAKMPVLRTLVLQSTSVTENGAQKFHALRPDVSISGDFNLPATSRAEDQPK